MANIEPLRFGVEVEAIFASFDSNTRIVLFEFAKILTTSCVANGNCQKPSGTHPGLISAFQDIPSGYKDWVVISEATLRSDRGRKKLYGLEIISPIMETDSAGTWRQEFIQMFNHIEKKCTITTNDTCAFHVHFSPGTNLNTSRDWAVEELRSICFAIIYFEEAFSVLLPELYRQSEDLNSHFVQRSAFKKIPREKCWTRILAVSSENYAKGFHKLMQLDDNLSNDDNDAVANSMAWNFGNLLKEKTKGTQMTIEWRQPPGVTTAEESLAWTELGLSLVQAARGWENIGNEIEDKYRGDVQGLKTFVKDRGEFPGSEMDRANAVFGDKSGRIEVLGPWARVDPADVFSNTHMQEPS